jgi:CRP-like cAMP-binding protein
MTFYDSVLRMPIDVEEFEQRSPDALGFTNGSHKDVILEFLGSHDDKAYTQTEIAEGTGIKRGSVGTVLARLEELGVVRHKGRYWTIADDDRVAAYRAGTDASAASVEDDYFGEDA